MNQCPSCGQHFVNDEDLSYHECFFVFKKPNVIKGLVFTISYNV